MSAILSRLRRARGGASALEFALLALPLAAMLLSVLEFGRLQWTRNALQQVAIAGARCVGLALTDCSSPGATATDPRVYDATKSRTFITGNASSWIIALGNSDITVSTSATCQTLANFTEVTLTDDFSSPFLAAAGLDAMTLSATACFPNQS